MKIFYTIKKLLLVVLFVSSIVLNVATHASAFVATMTAGMYTAVTGLTSHVKIKPNPVRHLKKTIGDITKRISHRTVVGAFRNVGSTFGEAIPYVGVAVVVGVTTLELNDACATLRDLHEVEKELNIEGTIDKDVDTVCGLETPTREEIWGKVTNSPEQVWNSVKELLQNLPNLEFPAIIDPLTTLFETIGNLFEP